MAVAGGGYRCFESGWCDLSGEHERVRRELEELIRCYVEGCGEEYWMPVIVAPYGSGKTTLLKHLEAYARGLGVAALRVELSELVDFIMERYGTIHESDLPRAVEEFARVRMGESRVYILLVDEVEESYDLLRGIVTFETSPFRGVAEAIRTGRSRVYLVLALGPSSTLKEAVFGPVAWRSRIYTIPLLPRSVVARMVAERVGAGRSDVLVELLANMVWWASKGRIAWARMLVDTVVPRLWEALGRGVDEVEAVLLGEEALGREIVEGVPLFDRQAFREAKRLGGSVDALVLLASLIGPAPLTLLSKLAGRELLPEPGSGLVYGRSLVRVEELLGEAQAWVERYARAKGIPSHSVEHALTALEHVVAAWSLGGRIIYDVQAWKELFSLAADIAREIFADDPHAAYLLEMLNPDLLSPPSERAGELYAALRPSLLGRLYPTASSTPLLGCARRAGLSQVVEVVESLGLDELAEYSGRVAEVTGLSHVLERRGLRVLFLPARQAEKHSSTVACRILGGERLLVVLLNPQREAGQAPRSLAAAAWLSGLPLVEAGQRLSLFIYSLLYSLSLGTGACSLDNLAGVDRRALRLYSDLLKSLVLDSLASRGEDAGRLRAQAESVERRFGGAAHAAAVLAAALPSPSKSLGGLVGDVHARLSRVIASLASLLGREASPPPNPLEVLEAVEQLAAGIPDELRDGLKGLNCGEAVAGRGLLPLLLGLAPPQPDAGNGAGVGEVVRLLEELRPLLSSLPREGVLGRLTEAVEAAGEALRRLKEAGARAAGVEGLFSAHLEALRGLLGDVEAWLVSLSKLYRLLEEMRAQLPDRVAGEVAKAVREDLGSINSLGDAAAYLESSVKLVSQMARLSSEASRVEEARRKLLETLDSLLAQLQGAGSPSVESVGGEVAA